MFFRPPIALATARNRPHQRDEGPLSAANHEPPEPTPASRFGRRRYLPKELEDAAAPNRVSPISRAPNGRRPDLAEPRCEQPPPKSDPWCQRPDDAFGPRSSCPHRSRVRRRTRSSSPTDYRRLRRWDWSLAPRLDAPGPAEHREFAAKVLAGDSPKKNA